MKASKETLAILKSFASINSCMYFGDPMAIKVRTPNTLSIIGVYRTPEEFKDKCVFWEMPTLLATIDSLGGAEADLQFNDKFLKIVSPDGKASLKYMYAPELVVSKHTPDLKEYDVYCKDIESDFTFELSAETLQQVMKLSRIMGFEKIQIDFDSDKGMLSALDEKGSVNHSFQHEVDGKGTGSITFSIDHLNIISGNYEIHAKSKTFAKLVNKDIPLFYIIGCKKEK